MNLKGVLGTLLEVILWTASFSLVLGALLIPWVLICRWAGKPGWRGLTGHWTKQLWGVLGLTGFVIGGGLGLVSAVLAPFPFIFLGSTYLLTYREFLASFVAIPAALAALAFLLMFRHPATRKVSFGISLLVLFMGSLLAAERGSQAEMCRTAEARGLTDLRRNSFYWSLGNAPDNLQEELHGAARLGDRRFGWSHYQMDWYEILPGTAGWVETEVFDCRPFAEISN
jgi:hypothetical protein